ncbi:hypothetical protein [Eisenibacter elegans]|jgi:hypothetical protein|uniref:hypothetical protein n=1 Tax=Eisenibacter elegans TaxID=997 RepID=UPI00042A7FEC|nr:hypothetical protein [Eisenibacter elegans]
MKLLINLVRYFRQWPALQVFTVYLRLLVGGGFIMAAISMGKLSGDLTTIKLAAINEPLDQLEPIQLFFRVMVTSGIYWQFIGWSQVLAGALLMTQRYSFLGACLFFGMMLNIFLITIAFDFRGTPIITGLMLLAAVYLLLWEVELWQFFFKKYDTTTLLEPQKLPIAESHYWRYLGGLMIVFIFCCPLFGWDIVLQTLSCLVIGFVAFLGFVFYYYPQRLRNSAKLA